MSTLQYNPIFLLSSERSGSNLLRKRFTENQDKYFGGSPAHLIRHLYYNEYKYGDLNSDPAFLNLIEDALSLCYIHYSPWNVSYDAIDILQEYKESGNSRNSIQLSHFLLSKYARDNGKQSYFCKDNFIYEFWPLIENEVPESIFIYLHRDPRDFVLSQIKRRASNKDVIKASRLWEYEQNKCIAAYQSLKLRNKCIRFGYEDLISDEVAVVRSVCEFAKVPYEPQEGHVDVMKQEVQDWKNLNRATIKDNMNKYKKELSNFSISLIEQSAWDPMNFLNYKPAGEERPKVNSLLRALYSFCKFTAYLPRYFMWRYKNIRTSKSSETSNMVAKREKLLQKLDVNYRNPK